MDNYIFAKEYIFYGNKRIKIIKEALKINNEYLKENNYKKTFDDLDKLYKSYPDNFPIIKPTQWHEYKDTLIEDVLPNQ